MSETTIEKDKKPGLKENISGLAQMIIGEIETLAGVVNADPLAQAEGEFNVEVGTIREDIEDDLEESGDAKQLDDADTKSPGF